MNTCNSVSISARSIHTSPTIQTETLLCSSQSPISCHTPLALSPLMADAENLSTTASADDDSNYGFTRAEMYSTNLAGTVDAYDRHLFLCYTSASAWPPRVEEVPLPKALGAILKSRKNDIPLKTRLTVCEGGESDGDVLIFPEMVRYKGLAEADAEGFVEDVLVSGKPWASGTQEVLTGSYVFVCTHGSRDKRCGVCGPALIDKFKEEIESRGLKDQVFVTGCSHVGGHKYAGNLIIFSPDSEGTVSGHWYGYVTPDDVPPLLDQHIAKREVIERLWRGQMGTLSAVSNGEISQNLPNGAKDSKQEETSPGGQMNQGGCCQGANGSIACCRDSASEVSDEQREKGNTECGGRTKQCGLKSWVGSWEQRDVLMAAAVVGAVATVAVAYKVYRKSG